VVQELRLQLREQASHAQAVVAVVLTTTAQEQVEQADQVAVALVDLTRRAVMEQLTRAAAVVVRKTLALHRHRQAVTVVVDS
jgi:hypothetical protein